MHVFAHRKKDSLPLCLATDSFQQQGWHLRLESAGGKAPTMSLLISIRLLPYSLLPTKGGEGEIDA